MVDIIPYIFCFSSHLVKVSVVYDRLLTDSFVEIFFGTLTPALHTNYRLCT